MIKLVRPSISVSIPFWISASVSVSTELVASSMMKISGSASTARARLINCFCPAESSYAALADLLVVALFQRDDEVVRARQLRRRLDLPRRSRPAAVADVLADRAAEQVRRLQHHADARLDGVLRHVGVVAPADQRCARRVGSKKRQIRLTIVDLPAPVGPTSAIVSPRLDHAG